MSGVYFSGSILPTANTQHVIGTVPLSAPGFYMSVFDVGAMRAGDIVTTGVLLTSTSWGTVGLGAPGGFSHEPIAQVRWSPPIPLFYGGQFFVRQTSGTPRWIDFTILSV